MPVVSEICGNAGKYGGEGPHLALNLKFLFLNKYGASIISSAVQSYVTAGWTDGCWRFSNTNVKKQVQHNILRDRNILTTRVAFHMTTDFIIDTTQLKI